MAAVATDAEGPAVGQASAKLTLLPLIALVIGSMIGGGVFNLETRAYMGKLAAASGGLIALSDLPEKGAEGHPMLLAVASTEADKSPAALNRSGKPTRFSTRGLNSVRGQLG